MEYEFNEDGYITVKYEISSITAIYSEDREDLIGICRLTSVDVECDGGVPSDAVSDLKNEIYNKFADVEYNTLNYDWKNDAESDIADYVGVSNDCVQAELE